MSSSVRVRDGEGVAGAVSRSRESLFVSDALNSPEHVTPLIRLLGLRTFASVPLLVADELVGVIEVAWREQQGDDGRAIELLQVSAQACSFAVANARLFEAEHRIADTLQEALLARPRSLPGVSHGHLYRAAIEATKVGGDFYDLFPLGERQLCLVVGDVSGKGIEAAALTALVRNAIRAYAVEGHPPSTILRMTNELLVQSEALPSFVTAFVGVLGVDSGELTYCSGGHPPGLVRTRHGVVALSASSPILGAFADLDFSEGVFVLAPSDALLLYTDGVTEARGASGLFGEGRLVSLLASSREVSTEDLPTHVYTAVASYSEAALSDDMAILVVSLDPPAGAADHA
jgi:serine phosphatase RsbU (regulator of sigma subunit)